MTTAERGWLREEAERSAVLGDAARIAYAEVEHPARNDEQIESAEKRLHRLVREHGAIEELEAWEILQGEEARSARLIADYASRDADILREMHDALMQTFLDGANALTQHPDLRVVRAEN